MPAFPVDLKTYLGGCARHEQQMFDLGQGLTVQNRTGGGEVIRGGGAARLWRGALMFHALRHDAARAMHARLHALAGAGACFWLRDYSRPHVENMGSVLSYDSVTMDALSLKGLPAGLVIATGDYVALGYFGRRALHQVVTGQTVRADGTTGRIEVVPPLRAGIAAGLSVSVGNPPLLAVMVPGTLRVGASGPVATSGAAFDWIQTLRETP